ncbi:twitchin-like isoform X1 [Sycon ciliatum]|uniref:twitchin-like isoform X1 n=2 Tax=Sycon ciliatum TaxID=27933 RepID=UPI0031F61725
MEAFRRSSFYALLGALLVTLDVASGQADVTVTVLDCVEATQYVQRGEIHRFSCEIQIDPSFPASSQPTVVWVKGGQGDGNAADFQPIEDVLPEFDIPNATYPTENTVRGEMEGEFTNTSAFGNYEARFTDATGRLFHTAMFTVVEASVPESPRPLENSAFQSVIKLEWQSITSQPPVTNYEIEFRKVSRLDNSTSAWRTNNNPARPNPFQIALFSTVSPFSRYQFRMRAQNAIGFSDYSGILVVETLPNSPKAPVRLQVVNTSQTTVTLQWQLSPEHRESDGIIEFYTVVYDTVNSTQSGGKQEQPVQVPRVNNITIATITGLTKGTEYEFRVKGSNGPYQTPLSSPLRVMTNSSVPGNYSSLSVAAIGHNFLLLELGNIDDGGSPLTKLILHRRTSRFGVESGEWILHSTIISPGEASHVMVSDLRENATYRFRLNVHNQNGKGRPASFTDLITTLVQEDVSDVANVSFTKVSPFSFHVHWPSAECPTRRSPVDERFRTMRSEYGVCTHDDVLNAVRPVLGYAVQYRLKGSSKWLVSAADLAVLTSAGSSLDHIIGQLLEDTEYEVRVLARDIYGPSPGMEVFTVRTHKGTPSRPRIVKLEQDGGRVVVHWELQAPGDNEYPVSTIYAKLLDSEGKVLNRTEIAVRQGSLTGTAPLAGLLANLQYTVVLEGKNTFGQATVSQQFKSSADAPPSGTPPPEIHIHSTRKPSSLSQTNLIIIIVASVLAPTLLLVLNLIMICACRRRRDLNRKRVWNVDNVTPPPPAQPSPPPPAWSMSADNVSKVDPAVPPGLAQRSAWDNRVHTQSGFESTTSLPAIMDTQDRRGLADLDEETAHASNIPTTFTSFGVDSPEHLPPPPLVTS